jgi:hypothetical protein
MKTPKKVIEKISLPLMFVMSVVAVLMFAVSPVLAAPVTCDPNFCDQDGDLYYRVHKRCPANCVANKGIDCDDSNPSAPDPGDPLACDPPPTPGSTPDPTTLTPCDDTGKVLCLASVDKWDRPAARSYVEDTFGSSGSYTKIPPKVFGDILAALPEDVEDPAFCKLYNAYNVLIFQWKSPDIKNLTWQSLVNYMACGGGVVFEDPSNVDALWPDVKTTNIHIRSNTTPPITIAFDLKCRESVSKLCDPLPLLPPLSEPTYEFDVENNHMEFDNTQPSTEPTLAPFLRLSGGEQIIGLYGEHSNGIGGRIVITGPDNSFHGNDSLWEYDPLKEAHYNQYHLLSREIDWLLLGGPAE